MKALLAGYGGIGKNVYYPELQKLGYEIDVLDIEAPNARFREHREIYSEYDIAVVCTPNFTHEAIATAIAKTGTKKIYIEKPGFDIPNSWRYLCDTYPDTRFHLVKNNLFRNHYGNILKFFAEGDVIGVDINWINDNRIPNPGSWFTNKKTAFGGVSHDLMPHLYCFAAKIFGEETIQSSRLQHMTMQRWDLKSIITTDYGMVNPKGIYNVDDTATVIGVINGVSLKMYASWKEGYNKQSITLYFRNGTTYEWNFGLCPADAYGVMLQDNSDSRSIDMAIHYFMEDFRAN